MINTRIDAVAMDLLATIDAQVAELVDLDSVPAAPAEVAADMLTNPVSERHHDELMAIPAIAKLYAAA